MSQQPPSNTSTPSLRWRAVGDRAPAELEPVDAAPATETPAESPDASASFAHLFPAAVTPYPQPS